MDVELAAFATFFASPLPRSSMASRRMTYSVPAGPADRAPATRSASPSRSMSPTRATEAPKRSESWRPSMPRVDELSSAACFAVPSGLRNRMWTAPRLLPPASSPTAPAAMSATPSPSTSPIPATEAPKLSLSASEGPFAVDEFISAVLFTVPSELRNRMWTAPRLLPPASSPTAPAAMSGTPSPSRSPMPAAEVPNSSLFVSEGPFVEFISAVLLTVPSELRNRMWTAPRSPPPASSPTAPTAMSGTPSRSRSPMPAAEVPNSSLFASEGPLVVDEFISAVLFTVPSELRNMTWTAPRLLPPASSPGAPTAMSATPSRSRSPMPAAEVPNQSPSASDGPFCVVEFISAVRWAAPEGLMNSRWTAPRLLPPASSKRAPTATSCVPSPSKSPTRAALFPKSSPAESEKPAAAPALITTVLLTDRSDSRNTTYIVPASPSPWPLEPATMSGTPSPSMSCMPETEEPNWSDLPIEGPLAVVEFISAARFTVPFEFIRNKCTVPVFLPPVPSSGVPAAMSATPSPSTSPMAATEWPSSS